MGLQTAPCEWPVDSVCCERLDEVPEQNRLRAVGFATEVLWALSGRRFGSCPVTVRPCRDDCASSGLGTTTWPLWGSTFVPVLAGGVWRNAMCGCRTSCSCVELCEVRLPGPVAAVTAVTLDGQPLPPESWRVDDFHLLVRTDGSCWPYCQDLTRPDTEPGTFSVTYRIGVDVPLGGLTAAGTLACEFLKACSGDRGCRLPRRVQAVSRQGVDVTLLDPMEFFDRGLTGVYEVDLWLRAVNPAGLTGASRVWSPDVPQPRRVDT